MNSQHAQQIFAKEFDADFFRLPRQVQDLITQKIDDMGARLAEFPHARLKGVSGNYRLRAGDYRVIYSFDLAANVVVLKVVGHRREIYR